MTSRPIRPSRRSPLPLALLWLCALCCALPGWCAPDLLIREYTGAGLPGTVFESLGDDVINADGAGQSFTKTILQGTEVGYVVTIRNDGDTATTFTLTGPAGGNGWDVRYYNYSGPGNNITGQVTVGGWITPSIDPGDSETVYLSIIAGSNATGTQEVLLTATDGANSDAVKATTTSRAATLTTTRVSVKNDGTQGNSLSFSGAMSGDGQSVAFTTVATTLVPGVVHPNIMLSDTTTGNLELLSRSTTDTSEDPCVSQDGRYVAFSALDNNGDSQVLVRDRQTDALEYVSVSNTGEPSNVTDYFRTLYGNGVAMSADGRYVAFVSLGTNLTDNDTNNTYDVFVRDRVNQTTECISVGLDGLPAGGDGCAISADGRYVAFVSNSSNLVAGDTNTARDVFVYDRTGQTMERFIPSTFQFGDSTYPAISGDGRYVAYLFPVGSVTAVYRVDRQTGISSRVDRGMAPATSTFGSGATDHAPAISADGRYVAYASTFNHLSPGDTNAKVDVFVTDMLAMSTQRVSISDAGVQGNNNATGPVSLSADGRYVAYASAANNLVSGDTNSCQDVFITDRGAGFDEVKQPDLHIRTLADETSVGNDLYNADGAEQTATAQTPPNTAAVYPITIQNDGNTAESFTIVGTAGGDGWGVSYFDALEGGTDITAQVTDDGWTSPALDPGESLVIRVEVTPDNTVVPGATKDVLVTATSLLDDTKSDTVKASTVAAIGVSTNPTDNAEMVWVPGGTFTMGTEYDPWWDAPHTQQVTLSGYWIYKYEVTVAQYRAFCAATGRMLPSFPSGYSWAGKTGWTDPTLQQHPIVNIHWVDAKAYADWAGVSLPTEAQWEYAARGPQGNNYPWGGTATAEDPNNGWDQTKCANKFNSFNIGKSTWPVGSFPAGVSWCGALDLAGNVWEWCADWYGPYSSTPVTNPTGSATESSHMPRSGSWGDELVNFFRGARRNGASEPASEWIYTSLGFRCASSPQSANTAPVPVADAYDATEDTPLTIAAPGVLGNDTDAEDDVLTAMKVSEPEHGTLTLNADGSFTYTPEENWHGTDSFTYKANDGLADSATATVTLTVAAANDAPTAVADAGTVDENDVLTVDAPGVLENDTDIDSATLTAVKVSDPTHGTVTLNADGSYTYTPDADWFGSDSFQYTANDGQADSAAVTVTITVVGCQPDLWVGGNGDGLYTADAQVATQTRATAVPAIYPLEIQNDGNAPDTFVITGGAGTADWTVAYYDAAEGGNVMTDAVTGDGWSVGPLEAGARRAFRLVVTPGANLPAGATYPIEVTAVSMGNAARQDTVRAVTTKAPLSAVTLTANPATAQQINQPITLTATPTGGGNVQYYFTVKRGSGEYQDINNGYGASAQCSYTATLPGTYTFRVSAREGATFVYSTLAYTVIPPPITGVTLTADPASPQFVETPVTLTADATGGYTVEYRFFASRNAGPFETIRSYGAAATCAWQPTLPGSYQLLVWAREVGGATRVHASLSYTIVARLSGVSLAATTPSTTGVGTPITLTATPVGGMAVQYRFSLRVGDGTYTEVQPYSPVRAFTYTPPATGSYTVKVEARECGGGDPRDCQAERTLTVVAPVSGVTLQATPTSPSPTGTPITLTATPTGGGTLEYRFFVSTGGPWTTMRGYATSPTVTWTPTLAGNYSLLVWAREVGSTRSMEAYATIRYTVVPALGGVYLEASPVSSALVDTPITFTATPTYGDDVEYRFFVREGDAWVTIQSYARSRTCVYTPTVPGVKSFLVWARECGSPHAYDKTWTIVNYNVLPHLSAVSLSADPAGPVAVNRRVRLTATRTGGKTVEYRFFIATNGGAFETFRPYSTTALCDWTPTAVGTYRLLVWAREVGSPRAWDVYATLDKQVMPAISGVTLSATPGERVAANHPVTLTANVTGGVNAEYRFFVGNGATWTTLRSYAPTPTATWTPSEPGQYQLMVYAREAGSTLAKEAHAVIPFTVVPALSGVTLAAVPGSPQPAGTPVTLTATPVNGNRMEYQFRLLSATGWTVIRPYAEARTCQWTPTQAGTYTIQVWVREVGNTADWEVWSVLSYTAL